MDRLEFEQLVSAWLDNRQDLRLRRRIDAACAADPACGRILAGYDKLDSLIRRAIDQPLAVNWLNFKLVVSTEIARTARRAPEPAELDSFLRDALPSIEPRVNWQCYSQRVSRAVDESVTAGRTLRIPRWRSMAAIAGLAAAAAVILWIGLHFGEAPVAQPRPAPAVALHNPPASAVDRSPTPAPAKPRVQLPVVAVETSEPVAPRPAPAIAAAIPYNPAIVHVHVIEEPAPTPALAQVTRHGTAERTSEPEVFFMLEPPSGSAFASAGGLSSY
jgi:hypothetical protein